MRSRIIKDGFSLRAFSNPAAPSGAVDVAKPALRKLSASRSTTSRSSSMIQTVFPEAGSMAVRFIAETVSVRERTFSLPRSKRQQFIKSGGLQAVQDPCCQKVGIERNHCTACIG